MALAVATCASTTGWWLHDEIIDPDGWSATGGDLLDDDEVAAEVAAIVTDRVVASLVDEVLDIPFLPSGIEDRAARTIRDRAEPAVDRLVRSEAASSAWRAAVERSHDELVAVIRDDDTTLFGDRAIRLDLAPLADRVVETVTGAVSGALDLGGIDVDRSPDLDLDLIIVLADLGDAELALDVAGIRTAEPDGLAHTWTHITATTTPFAVVAGTVGAAMVVAGGVLALLTRR